MSIFVDIRTFIQTYDFEAKHTLAHMMYFYLFMTCYQYVIFGSIRFGWVGLGSVLFGSVRFESGRVGSGGFLPPISPANVGNQRHIRELMASGYWTKVPSRIPFPRPKLANIPTYHLRFHRTQASLRNNCEIWSSRSYLHNVQNKMTTFRTWTWSWLKKKVTIATWRIWCSE